MVHTEPTSTAYLNFMDDFLGFMANALDLPRADVLVTAVTAGATPSFPVPPPRALRMLLQVRDASVGPATHIRGRRGCTESARRTDRSQRRVQAPAAASVASVFVNFTVEIGLVSLETAQFVLSQCGNDKFRHSKVDAYSICHAPFSSSCSVVDALC